MIGQRPAFAREVQMSGSCSVASVGSARQQTSGQSTATLGSLSGFAAFSAASLGSLAGLVPH
jgi:hypothetical protein